MSEYKFDEGDDIVFFEYPEHGEMTLDSPPFEVNEGDAWEFADSRGRVWRGTFGKPQPPGDLDPEGTRYTIPMRYEAQP